MSRQDARHWKLTDEAMDLLLQQLDLRMAIIPYDELAKKTGLTPASARVTMWNLMHEKRANKARVHRGTAKSKLEQTIAELQPAADASAQC